MATFSAIYKIPMFTWYEELSVLLNCITCPSSLSDIELSNNDQFGNY